jgi:two-component system, NarL family, sensor kinase
MNKLIGIAFILSSFRTVAFETEFADSMANEAKKQEAQTAIPFMLDHFYSVFSRNSEDGFEWMETCLGFARQSGNQQLIGRSHLNLGVAYYLGGDYPACLEHYLTALDIFEKTNDKAWIGRTCNELSVYTRKQKQFETALEYLDRSFENCTAAHDSGCVETSLNNRAVVYELMGNYELAIVYYRKAEQIAKANSNEVGLAYIYADAAECYRRKNDLDSCMILIDLSISILDSYGNLQGVAMNILNKAIILAMEKDYGRAVEAFEQCIRIAGEIGYNDLLQNAHYELGRTYADMKDFEKSFYHIDQSYVIRDQLLNEEKLIALSEMEVKYETEKVEKDYLKEQQNRIESDLKVESRNKWLIGVSGFFLASVFFGLFIYQRKSRIVQAEKDRAIIAEREKGLQAVFDATEEERQRIAKDLHDGIGQQMSGLKMAWQNLSTSIPGIGEKETAKIGELTKILDSTASEVRDLSHQMMPKVLEEFGLVLAIEGMLEKSLKLTSLTYNFEHYNIEGRLKRNIELSLFRITQELLNNVIKHSGATHVAVQLFKNKNQLILIVEDDGKGFESERKKEGHGLMNIQSRLRTIHGQVNYEASSNAGTTVTIRVDLSSTAA